MFIIYAHLDLSMNALEWNRDLTKSAKEINLRERGLKAPQIARYVASET